MLATLLTAGFCSLFALGLAVERSNRFFRGAMATIVAATLLALTVAYLDLAFKRLPTASVAHAAEPRPASQTACVRQGVVPACNCVEQR